MNAAEGARLESLCVRARFHAFGPMEAVITPVAAPPPTVVVMPPGADASVLLPRIREAVPSPSSGFGNRWRGSAPAVHAAYLADVEGMTARQIAASGRFPFTTERAARQHIRDGRLTASDLGVWPWAVVDGKSLPRNWWADPAFAHALEEYATQNGPA